MKIIPSVAFEQTWSLVSFLGLWTPGHENEHDCDYKCENEYDINVNMNLIINVNITTSEWSGAWYCMIVIVSAHECDQISAQTNLDLWLRAFVWAYSWAWAHVDEGEEHLPPRLLHLPLLHQPIYRFLPQIVVFVKNLVKLSSSGNCALKLSGFRTCPLSKLIS